METLQFENENEQAIQVSPETVEKVLVAPAEGWAILCIGTIEIVVHGDAPAVAKRIGDARGFDCPCTAPEAQEPPPASLPAGDPLQAPPPGEAPPEPAGDAQGGQDEAGDEDPPPSAGRMGGRKHKKR